MKLFRILLWIQTIYYFLTAAWGLIDTESFMRVTGPKTDVWLVKTVSVILFAVSFSFISYLFIKTNYWPAIILASSCCLFLACIDFYYAGRNIISDIYLLDGIVEIALLIGWGVVIRKYKKQKFFL
jgi:hypothetical protein